MIDSETLRQLSDTFPGKSSINSSSKPLSRANVLGIEKGATRVEPPRYQCCNAITLTRREAVGVVGGTLFLGSLGISLIWVGCEMSVNPLFVLLPLLVYWSLVLGITIRLFKSISAEYEAI